MPMTSPVSEIGTVTFYAFNTPYLMTIEEAKGFAIGLEAASASSVFKHIFIVYPTTEQTSSNTHHLILTAKIPPLTTTLFQELMNFQPNISLKEFKLHIGKFQQQ
jgi:hypothetical protein